MSERDAPWWLAGGTEHCPFCLQRYALEVELRCTGCDRGMCAHCVTHVHVHEDVWCPECGMPEETTAAGEASPREARP